MLPLLLIGLVVCVIGKPPNDALLQQHAQIMDSVGFGNLAMDTQHNGPPIPNPVPVGDPYKCYHWTATDKFYNYWGWWSDETQRQTCESHGHVFSKGDDNKAPGCGDCWCCQPAAREKECAIFDDLWNADTYTYKVPSKSFCSDYCTSIGPIDRSNPYWFECTEKTMPDVEFFMGNDQSCSVVTRNGRNDNTNQDCMNQVSIYMTGSNVAKLVYLTHGFMGDDETWAETTKDVLLKRYHNTNIVIGNVYWEHGARVGSRSMIKAMIEKPMICCHAEILSYGRAASSTWAIGNILAYVNKELSNMATTNRIQTSCVGHSLGAHVCGFFGKMVKMLNPNLPVNKIIGLDPAGPIFEYKDSNLYQDPKLRLNNADAINVEIFHTSTDVLGFKDPLGDLDFYINGGKIQPGCDGVLEGVHGTCSHNFAPKLFDYVNKNNVSCYSKWKCYIVNGSKVENIVDENQTELNNAGCCRHTKVKLGTLDQTITNGIYWVDVDINSKTCSTAFWTP